MMCDNIAIILRVLVVCQEKKGYKVLSEVRYGYLQIFCDVQFIVTLPHPTPSHPHPCYSGLYLGGGGGGHLPSPPLKFQEHAN